MKAVSAVPISVEGPDGPIRLKWHKLRTSFEEAPFKLSNLTHGWRLGASLEIDIRGCADGRFVVAHDATLCPATTGHGWLASIRLGDLAGCYHRDRHGVADHDAPVTALLELISPLRTIEPGEQTMLQLDLKLGERNSLSEDLINDAAQAVAGLERNIVIGSQCLDQARALVIAIPVVRLGYDPMRAISRDASLLLSPERLLRHLERRRTGVSFAYLRYNVVLAAAVQRFPLVQRLLDLGIETDAWTVNPGRAFSRSVVQTLVMTGVRQITTDCPVEIAQMIATLG